jgi:4a-hydroxytetrahydrobiopterin dehydratase
MSLAEQKCVPCEGGTPPLDQAAIDMNLAAVPGWQQAGNTIKRDFKFKDFAEAMGFVNRVAVIAEAEGHHPDLALSYNHLTITLSTHTIGGLSVNDFIVAAKINKLCSA